MSTFFSTFFPPFFYFFSTLKKKTYWLPSKRPFGHLLPTFFPPFFHLFSTFFPPSFYLFLIWKKVKIRWNGHQASNGGLFPDSENEKNWWDFQENSSFAKNQDSSRMCFDPILAILELFSLQVHLCSTLFLPFFTFFYFFSTFFLPFSLKKVERR